MLDPGREDVARDALAQEARAQIEAEGTLKQENKWGLRKMAYEIEQRTEADYRWFRFEAPSELLDGLNHNLRIADGVLRFRIFKVDPETPDMVPPAVAAPAHGGSRDRDRDRGPQTAAPPEPADTPEPPAPEPAGTPEPPAEPEPAAAPPAEGDAPAEGETAPAETGEAAASTE
jgi:small subunit ribosomal protein S6